MLLSKSVGSLNALDERMPPSKLLNPKSSVYTLKSSFAFFIFGTYASTQQICRVEVASSWFYFRKCLYMNIVVAFQVKCLCVSLHFKLEY